eukprot:m.262219 g.262219  ORF g.262219 m.262219 type:complete len:162 (-) comp15587_c2_seq2:287-772(-)
MAAEEGPVLFYGRQMGFYEFSNFYKQSVWIDGLEWPTTEHYFQAMKFPDRPDYQERIRLDPSPAKAKKLGRQGKLTRVQDWDRVKDDVMEKACMAKFSQHKHLKAILLSTGERELVEHTANDRCWGDGGDGSGQNKLGKCLMRVRAKLREQEQEQDQASQS